jgi:hypothetical protein
VGIAFAGATTARATTTNYWGYNNMTKNNPSAGTCSSQGAGFACSGWNNWDRSQIDWNSGNAVFIFFGFQNCAGCTNYGTQATYAKTWTLLRTDYNSMYCNCINTYNRATVAYDDGNLSTYAYLQGRAIIF